MRTNLIFFDTEEESKKGFIRWLIVFIIMLFLYFGWFYISKKYVKYPITKSPNVYSIILVCILLSSALAVQNNPTYKESLVYSMLVGLVVAGVYNFTNYSMLNEYSLKTSIIDTLRIILSCIISNSILWLISWKKEKKKVNKVDE